MKNYRLTKYFLLNLLFAFFVFALDVQAQIRPVLNPPVAESEESDAWWYITLFVLVVCLAGVLVWWMKGKKAEKEKTALAKEKAKNSSDSWDNGSVDADKELEWLRKNQNIVDKRRKKNPAKKKLESAPAAEMGSTTNNSSSSESSVDPDAPLPVFAFQQAELAKPFTQLPLSRDEALLSAIEQAHDEDEEDEEVRELALRILTAFKTRNSVEALSQMALYDLSSALRSKAVLTLSEFDHESVFEIILLACADPTREVRATAARGLTRLSFDRADAWTRIAQSGETGRIRQAARAAIESGFVERSFDRLIHPDRQYSYEAFVLLSLLVKAGETEQIFTTLKDHKNAKVQQAILHLLTVTKDQEAFDKLLKLAEDRRISNELKKEIEKTMEAVGLVAA